MTTNKLIKLLKEQDPSGECHVRINGDIPYDVIRKPGYYDGYYNYIEDDKFVFSKDGDKIDIDTFNFEDWVFDNIDISFKDNIIFKNIDKNKQESIFKELKHILYNIRKRNE